MSLSKKLFAIFQTVRSYVAFAAARPPLMYLRRFIGIRQLFYSVLASRYDRKGQYVRAAKYYRRALRSVDKARWSRGVYVERRELQFSLARANHRAGLTDTADPLFQCRAEYPESDAPVPYSTCKKSGFFEVLYFSYGMRISGIVRDPAIRTLDVAVNGVTLRTVKRPNTQGSYWFRVNVRRPALELFPRTSELTVRGQNGSTIGFREQSSEVCSVSARLLVPHGNDTLSRHIASGGGVDKKGYLTQTTREINQRHETYLDLYMEARQAFRAQFDKELFLMYGTLLGLYRNGDFIAGDDDFDVGYVSHETTAAGVKAETQRIVRVLVEAGFTVGFNTRGRPFRLRRQSDNAGLHLDVRPLWFQSGHVWAHLQACLPTSLDTFEQTVDRDFRGRTVSIPAKTETFLELYYGKSWSVPDPSYTNSDKTPQRVHRHLARTCMRPFELRALQRSISNGSHQGAGDVVSTVTVDLYPLDQYERVSGW